MSWIALADEVGAILHAVDDDRVVGAVNLTAPNPVTNLEFTRTLGQALHRPTVLPTPLPALRLLYGGELVRELLLFSQRVRPDELVSSGYEFRRPQLLEALQATLAHSAA
jgi:NAD dependent epimerase/dehydratase family enzyme